jgi:hypothetical protein
VTSDAASPDEATEIEDLARRLHRLDASADVLLLYGPQNAFLSWDSAAESTKQFYREQARRVREDRAD